MRRLDVAAARQLLEFLLPFRFRLRQRRVFGNLETVEPQTPHQRIGNAPVFGQGAGTEDPDFLRAEFGPIVKIVEQARFADPGDAD